MNVKPLIDFSHKFIDEMPPPVKESLIDVDILVCEDLASVRKEFEDVEIPDDTKGLFVGEPAEEDDPDDEDPEDEGGAFLPEGEIILIAPNIANEDEATLVLCHEIGHALGLDEQGVADLGLGFKPSGGTTDADGQKQAHSA